MKKQNTKKLSGILSILLILAVLASGFAMMGCTPDATILENWLNEGGTFTLGRNMTLDRAISKTKSNSAILDLNGFRIEAANGKTEKNKININGGKLTVKDGNSLIREAVLSQGPLASRIVLHVVKFDNYTI